MQGAGAVRRVFPTLLYLEAYGAGKTPGSAFPAETRIKLSALYFPMHFGPDEFSLVPSAL
jgi:hypothetical protein